MPTTPKPATPTEIAAGLAPLIAADAITVSVVLAGYFRAVRENHPGQMAGLKAGLDPLRIECEKWRRAFLDARRNGADVTEDPMAALLAAGAALVTHDES
jgi:hypothetical protein